MLQNVLSGFEHSDKTEERAENEAFEFSVPDAGIVVVSNLDHDSAHAVTVEDGVPVACSCPADTYHSGDSGACKHRVAVAMVPPALDAASTDDTEETDETRAIADGGAVVSEAKPPESQAQTRHVEDCDDVDCEGLDGDADRPQLSFPCWSEWAAYSEEELIEVSEQ